MPTRKPAPSRKAAPPDAPVPVPERPPIDRMPVERRRRLVRRAAEEFATAGYEQASLNRIIRDCGLSKSSFYYVVASKQELFDLVVRDLGSELLAQARIPAPAEFGTGDFWGRVDELLRALTRALLSDQAYALLGRMFYLSDLATDPTDPTDPTGAGEPGTDGAGSPTAVAEAFVAIGTWLREVLEVGRRAGAVRRDLPIGLQAGLAFAVLRALDEWGVARAETLSPARARRLVRAMAAAIRRLLAPDPPRSGS